MAMMVVLIKLFEEREAIEKFGEDYRKYMQTTPMFCVRIACLKELMGWHT
jgi:protein-S-isoprenylcysteine O-methyltransferase Ste14